MILRCLLFSSDRATAELIRPALADLDVEAEYCEEAAAAIERVANDSFQIVILDWDNQPDATELLKSARERKASERPLTLAIVSDDANVPVALRAGANSILRRPIIVSQVKDTLTSARDLLRAKQESAATFPLAAAATAASPSSSRPASMELGAEKALRAGEFVQSSGSGPGAELDTQSDADSAMEPPPRPVDRLQDLQSIAAAPAAEGSAPLSASDEPRGLEWYMKRSGASPRIQPQVAQAAAAAAPAPAKSELLGFDQLPAPASGNWAPSAGSAAPSSAQPGGFTPETSERNQAREKKTEAELFAHISGVSEFEEKEAKPPSGLGKRAVLFALAVAACAVVAAPQAPWHPDVLKAWARTQKTTQSWLNPQVETKTAPAPAAHEDFGRAGDEYKLPVAENIPDATTDPSRIRIVPMVDPTAKQPNNNGAANTGQTPGQVVPEGALDPPPSPEITVKEKVAEAPPPASLQGDASTPVPAALQPTSSETPAVSTPAPVTRPQVIAPKTSAPASQYVAASPRNAIPSSLKSQMASTIPEASGNKPPESAMPSIEPVVLSEVAARSLLTDQPDLTYPASANGQQGKVVLQVLIGRDGSVQDAKFIQGSLAFARPAIDNVKLWHFKPYLMNGRAVSVQTPLTVSFKRGQ